MCEFRVTKLVTPEGFSLERTPSPFELAGAVPPTTAASPTDDEDDVEDDEAKEKSLRAAWNEHWKRLTLSSGASVPPFPGPDRAMRVLGHS